MFYIFIRGGFLIEICFSDGFKGTLKNSNCSNDILSLPLAFNIGDEKEIENLTILDNMYIENSHQRKTELANKLKLFKETIINNSEFRIWYSYQSPEYCGLLYVINKIASISNPNIYTVNCSLIYNEKDKIINFNSTNEISTEYIDFFKNKQQKININDINQYIYQYKNLFKENNKIRINNNNKIICISKKECVDILYSFITIRKKNIISTISNILQHTYLDINSLLFGLFELINDGKIEIKNEYIIKK